MTKQIVWTLIVRGLLIAAGFVSSIITARFLGPEGRGVFFYWTTLAAFAIQFGNLGLLSSNTYLLTKGRAPLSALAANSLWVSLIGGGILGWGLALSLSLIDGAMGEKWSLLLPALFLIPSGLYFLLGTNLLVAEGRIGEYNGFELANRYLGLAATFFAAWYWRSSAALLVMMSVVAGLMCLPLYHRMKVLGGKGGGSFLLLREGFGYAMRAYLGTVLGFAVLRVNTLLVEKYTDAETFGVWSISAQLLDVIIVIPSTIALVLFPRIMRSEQPYQLMQSQLRLVTVTLVLVCAVVAWLGHGIIMLIYGKAFAGAYTMLLWGLPGIFALGLTSILSQYLASAGIPLSLVFIWMTGLVVELLLALWLIPIHGGIGGMLALSVAYLLIFGMVWVLAANHHSTQRKKSVQRHD
ncbi:oligosaccharide flippase family protein [Laribacter hongkongensis]|uniref:lipopolysaccharide biosynthesis protein n=1 Tax=Laribacter hongkongensis TaxID=168471 RepID=UPI001EFD4345|nr:oligosaccharide flippase family protein [Laribacter hongkongensis]MCG8992297.1 oligosaccharide flippase family protein [Laribacter hongkongensis]MCG8999056.1 oligosaccharide flippase family protein [Laribacter hongkongensis]MCG9001729.1 oligosaccharide flippase family protein [Laribacter hongkongensis]MCG9004993.1 oligosaccharide flippase family protein [Laribacter hongkongensis]MCG9007213.1 oligosaccharide flippase family protein [Laribacter hongkongensis]